MPPVVKIFDLYPPASEASRGGIILTEEKKHTPTRIWCQYHSQGGMKFATQISPLLD